MVREPVPEFSPCPTGCGAPARRGSLMCPSCWRQVPRGERQAVTRARREYCSDPTDARWFVFVEAREAALGAVAR